MASLSAFTLLLLVKWKIIEWMQVHGNDFLSKMANCDFCLSWWVNVILSIILFAVTLDVMVLAVPFCSTMLTRKLI
jgi:hypothetical protein